MYDPKYSRRIASCLLFAALLLLVSTSTITASTLTLVKDGNPACSIVVPNDADEWTSKAAQWLKEYVHKVSGAELTIFSEDQAPSGTLISVGDTKLAEKAGIDVSDLKWDGCKMVVNGDLLYLLGRDQAKEIKDYPLVGARGTCRAVVTFLEDFCGVRWFLPTPEGEVVPRTRDISVPRDLTKTAVPAFAYSHGRTSYADGTPASIANNFRDGIGALVGGHSYGGVVPGDKYFKDHPEYFALINGKRTAESPWPGGEHLCSSNPEVKKLLSQWQRERFDEGYEWVFIGQEDGYRRCECAECEKLDDYRYESTGLGWEDFMYGALRKTPCDRLFLLHKYVIDEARESHPDRKVLLNCYAPTAWPSKKIAYFGDNVIAHLMNQEPEFIKAWKGKVSGFAGYVYWFNSQTSMGMDVHLSPRELSEKIRYLHKNGFVGLYHYIETNWGLQGPVYYVLGRMMGDPARDYRALVEEYCQGLYGKAGMSMIEFFDLIYARHEEVLPLPVEDFGGRINKMPRWITTTDLYLMHYPPAFLDQLERLLQKAESEADTERSRGSLRLTRDHFDFTKLLTQALISYRAYQANPSTENWLELKEQVEAFDAYRMRIITYPKEYTDAWFPGYGNFCNYLTADAQSEMKVYYVPWENRKADVLARGVKGTAIGYGGGTWGYSVIKEPLTMNFDQPPSNLP